MVSESFAKAERDANLPHPMRRGNRHGESIMIDPALRMNQIATAFDHDMRWEKAAGKVAGGNPSWASCSTLSAS
jgi:hypothetical protein